MEAPPPNPARIELVAPDIWVAQRDLSFVATRSRGPGGQSVNKVSSAVQMRVAVTAIQGLSEAGRQRLRQFAGQRLTRDDDILINADTHRSQLLNRRACVERLVSLVAQAAPEPVQRRPTRPSRRAKARRKAAKQQQSEKKQRRRSIRPDDG
jgi:ribosome-associated protein